MELCIAVDRMNPIERCGCGAKSEIFGRRMNTRASRSATATPGLDGYNRIALVDRRRRGASLRSDHTVRAEKQQLWSPRSRARKAPGRYRPPTSSAGEFGDEREEKRDFVTRAQRAFGFKENVGVETRNSEKFPSYKWKLLSAAAAAGLSWTLCSSAVANPITIDGPVQMPNTPVSENLRTHVETQLRRELQVQIKVQKDWLDEIGQPLSQWSIDDHVRKNLEERSKSRLDESGKAVSKLEMLESEVVPIFKPSVVTLKKDKVANAGTASSSAPSVVALKKDTVANAGTASSSAPSVVALKKDTVANAGTASSSTQEALQDKASSQSPPVAVERKESSVAKVTPQEVKPTLDRTAELVAVAAIPLGPVVSAASRTVGSAASLAAMQVGAPAVPGMSLLTRIISHFGGGGVAGAMGATLVYPLDTIKTRMQAQSDEEGEEAQFKDEWDCLRQLIAKEGVGSLYSGLVPQLVGIAPEKAIKLTVNEILMEMLECQMPSVGVWALELIAGGGGGFSQIVFTNPMEIVKVRLQTQAKDVKQKNSWDVIKELGVRGLYNGSAMTMARDIPSSAIFFALYTLIKQVYPDQSFVAGFMAAIPATVLVTPFDVVKTRLQMERAAGEVPYENGYACFIMILQKEGVGALFKGSVARVLKTSPQFGITFMLYNLLCGGS